MQRGKKYEQAASLIEKDKPYGPDEAISLAKRAAPAKFDETVELHLRTGLDPRHADQQIRGTALLPHGLGKKVRVLVFTEGGAERDAEDAGADFVGGDELITKIEGGWTDFDVALATRDMMTKVSRLGRVLGPRGLMPNPRTNTVVEPEDIAKAVTDARQGRVEFRLDRTALIHVPIGKVSFEPDQLLENMGTIVNAIVAAKPSGTKGQYIRGASLATTMGPGIRLELNSTLAMSGS